MTIPVTGSFLTISSATWLSLLLNAAIKGSVILCVTLLLMRLLARRPSALRSFLWTLVFIAVLIAPSVLPQSAGDRAGGEWTPWHLSVAPQGAAADCGATGGAEFAAGSEPATSRSAIGKVSHFLPRVAGLAAPLWLLAALLLLGRSLILALATRRVLTSAVSVQDPAFAALLRKTRDELGLTTQIAACTHHCIQIPFVWGLRRPTLVLPQGVSDWDVVRQQAVLRHELAHVVRRDPLRMLLIEIACSLHWFNPLVWIAARRARLEMEAACDDRVLELGASTLEYARQLLLCAAEFGRARGIAGALSLARCSDLEERMRKILARHPRCPRPGRIQIALAILGVSLLALPLTALPVVMKSTAPPTERPEHALVIESRETPSAPRVSSIAMQGEIHTAAREGDRAAVAGILASDPAALESRDGDGMTPLSLAAWNSHTALVADLVGQGAEIDSRNENGLTPLFCALDRGRRTVAWQLIAAGADIHARGYRGRTILHNAVRCGQIDIVQHLIAHGAEINARDVDGRTPIQFAHARGHEQVVRWLREHGAIGSLDADPTEHRRSKKKRLHTE